ncbi:hypothetical protein Salat_0222500 [Sesamum alatum]|uniref:Uncharacterized protein n=1 Tax=Sesamum alatum TaxID=300844 RepID=A0AAE1YYZ0_9LAMI|nr:hypothetical protein Salat_0222500 [Sesamum alatum]
MGGLTGYLFPQPIRDSVFSTKRGLEYLSKGHKSTHDKKRRSMVPKGISIQRRLYCEPKSKVDSPSMFNPRDTTTKGKDESESVLSEIRPYLSNIGGGELELV